MIVLFGDAMPQPGSHARQDNDFFYLCGVEDLNAILVLNARTKEAHLFLPRQLTREEMQDGSTILRDPRTRENLGLANIYDQAYFDEFVARNAAAFAVTWLRLGAADTSDYDRAEMASLAGRKDRLHYNAAPLLNDYRALRFRERHPAVEIRDVTPHLDALRQIKSAEEIAILRRGGWLSAEAVKLAMATSRPGVFEYELEACPAMTRTCAGPRTGTWSLWISARISTTSAWPSPAPGRSAASSRRTSAKFTRSSWRSKKRASRPIAPAPPRRTSRRPWTGP
jgi:Xaa-Pro aminopeptidase